MKAAVREMAKAEDLVRESRDRLMSELSDPSIQQYFLDSFKAALARGDLDMTKLHAEIMGLKKAPEQNVTVVLAQRYGLDSERELERIIDRHKEVSQLSAEQKFQRCLQFVREFLFQYPERKKDAMVELGIVTVGGSYAEEA